MSGIAWYCVGGPSPNFGFGSRNPKELVVSELGFARPSLAHRNVWFGKRKDEGTSGGDEPLDSWVSMWSRKEWSSNCCLQLTKHGPNSWAVGIRKYILMIKRQNIQSLGHH